MADNKQPSGFKKVLNVLFNIFWVIMGGITMAVSTFMAMIGSCIAIIPIFFGIPKVYWRVIPLFFAPAGKTVEIDFGKAPVRNAFYLILGGAFNMIGWYIYGALLCVTIIFIPVGLQVFKFAKYFIAPFGAKVLKQGQDLLPEEKPVEKQPKK